MTTPIQRARAEGYLHRCVVAIDQFCNVLIGGLPDETLSAHAQRSALAGNWFALLVIWALDKISPGHGAGARLADLGRAEIVEEVEKAQ